MMAKILLQVNNIIWKVSLLVVDILCCYCSWSSIDSKLKSINFFLIILKSFSHKTKIKKLEECINIFYFLSFKCNIEDINALAKFQGYNYFL